MQLTGAILTLGSLATMASGSAIDALNNAMAKREFVFPASVPLAKRAVTGAAYQCHANCGYTILNADTAGYCDDSDWTDLLAACLACANEYDLWPDYGSGVEAAASACGLSAVPSGSSGSASTTAAAAGTTSAAAAAQTTTAAAAATTSPAETKAEETKAAETSAAAAETKAGETAAASETAAVTTASAVGTPTGSNSTSSTPTSSVVQAGAPEFVISNILVAGAALVAVAGLM